MNGVADPDDDQEGGDHIVDHVHHLAGYGHATDRGGRGQGDGGDRQKGSRPPSERECTCNTNERGAPRLSTTSDDKPSTNRSTIRTETKPPPTFTHRLFPPTTEGNNDET